MKYLLTTMLMLAFLFTGMPVLADHGTQEGEEHDQLPPGMGEFGDEFRANQAERRELHAEFASSTLEERKHLLFENIRERRALFASSTAAKILEARKEFLLNHGSTTNPFPSGRWEHFGSTTLTKADFTEQVKARILAHAEHAAELLDAMLARLAGIADRIAKRMEELEAEGIDVSLAQTELAQAYDAIEAAGTVVEGVKEKIAEALESETPREMMEAAKAAGDEAKEALRAAYGALKEVMAALPKPPESEEGSND